MDRNKNKYLPDDAVRQATKEVLMRLEMDVHRIEMSAVGLGGMDTAGEDGKTLGEKRDEILASIAALEAEYGDLLAEEPEEEETDD